MATEERTYSESQKNEEYLGLFLKPDYAQHFEGLVHNRGQFAAGEGGQSFAICSSEIATVIPSGANHKILPTSLGRNSGRCYERGPLENI